VATAIVPTAIIGLGLAVFLSWPSARERGKQLNQTAWERSYTERGLQVPRMGPRDGYWGDRLRRAPHKMLGWHEHAIQLAGLLEFDEDGVQRYVSRTAAAPAMPGLMAEARKPFQVLILGGSVAYGGYASSIATTYFHVLGTRLDHPPTASNLTIVAASAWKSAQELAALELYGARLDPDLVIFVNGLNDLTNGATARSLYGQPVPTADGSDWTPLYHSHDYPERVAEYLDTMRRAARFTTSSGSDLLVVLQPSLVERTGRTAIEEQVLQGALLPHASARALLDSYETMRRGLRELAATPGVHFLDGSRLLNEEGPTTFVDIWHFSDRGHALLGEAIGAAASRILTARAAKAQPRLDRPGEAPYTPP
jgi:hypothetical protein